MTASKCSEVSEAIRAFLAKNVSAQDVPGACIVTLPVPAADGRLIDIFIESKIGSNCLIHDGGKAANEIIMSGVDLTPRIKRRFDKLARTFKVFWDSNSDMFTATCKADDLSHAVLRLAGCSALATYEIAVREAFEQEEEEAPIRAQFSAALAGWAKTARWGNKRPTIREKVSVTGRHSQHEFDFLVDGKRHSPVAVSILIPTNGSRSAAERFGFKVADTDHTEASKWKRLAVAARAEDWSDNSRGIVRACADDMIEIGKARKPIQNQIEEAMERLA